MRHKFFPVIHIQAHNAIQYALDDIAIAQDIGADGVFIIDHNCRTDLVKQLGINARKQFTDFFIGVNFLQFSAEEALRNCNPESFNALWTDSFDLDNPVKLERFKQEFIHRKVLHFGGFDFKYQKAQPASQALQALGYVDVLTTSGSATGSAPSLEKVAAIRKVIGENSLLAIASGANSANVTQLATQVNYFLVASSICTNDRLDKQKAVRFIRALHSVNISRS